MVRMLQSLKSISKLIIYFTGLVHFVAAQSALVPQGSQFILYSGSISGSTSWTSTAVPEGDNTCSASGTDSVGPYAATDLYVGVNPPWDPNPFFFELWHLASDCDSSFCWTKDKIYNLDFASAAYECISKETGQPCEFITLGYYYQQEIYLDLKSKSTIQRQQIGGETGYTVSGGSSSWVGNDSANGADVLSECNWPTSSGYDELSWLDFTWNNTTPINYTLSFTNTTASFTLTTTMISKFNNLPASTLILSFTGTRNDTPVPYIPYAEETHYPMQLNTSLASEPQFNFLNGSEISFKNDSGTWIAAAADAAPVSLHSPSSTYSFTYFDTATTSSTGTASTASPSPTKNGAVAWRNEVGNVVEISVVVNLVLCILTL